MPVFYLEPSALVKYYVTEPGSTWIRQVVDECESSEICCHLQVIPHVSGWGLVSTDRLRTGMIFYAVLDQVMALLRGRVTYNALKLQFDLDNAHLENKKFKSLFRSDLPAARPDSGRPSRAAIAQEDLGKHVLQCWGEACLKLPHDGLP